MFSGFKVREAVKEDWQFIPSAPGGFGTTSWLMSMPKIPVRLFFVRAEV